MFKNTTQKNICMFCNKDHSTIIASGTDFQYNNTNEIFYWKRCNKCNHHFIDPKPSKEYLVKLYSGIGNYGEFDEKPGLAFKIKRLLDRINLKKIVRKDIKNLRFLDVGCSPGAQMDIVSKYFPEFETIEGIEMSEEAAQTPKSKGFNVYTGFIEDIDLKDNFYDLIYMQQVIEHLVDPKLALDKLYNSLRSGGSIVFETPGLFTWDYKIFIDGYWEGFHIPRHLNLWTTDGFYKMLKDSKFKNISHKYKIRPIHWTVSIQNYLIKKNKLKFLQNRMNMNVNLPFEIILFSFIELFQKFMTGKTSDVQYIAKKE